MGLFSVYRLEVANSLLKEGGVWVSGGALRAGSYKTHPKPKHQGEAPRLFKGFILVFVLSHGLCALNYVRNRAFQ